MYIRLLSALLLAVALTTACIKPENKNELVEISNFRFGLVKFDDDQRPHIYKEGDEFPFEENGTCVANGESYPCLWRGFEFSYKSPTEYTKFDCLATLNHPTNHVYPDRVVKENTKTIQYSFVVEGRSGHYIRPQYTYGLKEHPEQSSTVCTANGQQEVLKWKYTLNPLPTVK